MFLQEKENKRADDKREKYFLLLDSSYSKDSKDKSNNRFYNGNGVCEIFCMFLKCNLGEIRPDMNC